MSDHTPPLYPMTVIPAQPGFFLVCFDPPDGEADITAETDPAAMAIDRQSVLAWAVSAFGHTCGAEASEMLLLAECNVEPICAEGRVSAPIIEPLLFDPARGYTWWGGTVFLTEEAARIGWKEAYLKRTMHQARQQ